MPRSLLLTTAVLALAPTGPLLAQGSLTPPGAPAPTQKALSQIEPRTPVSTLTGDASATFVISQPGSYYLTGNITAGASQAGIAIAADQVHLDLAGFTISGGGSGTSGVEIRGTRTQVVVENGFIRNFTVAGVSAVLLSDARVERLNIAAVSGAGINLGSNGASVSVKHCTVNDFGSPGGILTPINRGTVEHSTVSSGAATADCIGIQAGKLLSCEVSSLTSSAGSLTAITSGGSAVGCVVTNITLTGGAAQCTGISAAAVANSLVSSISASSGTASGITSLGVVENSTVSFISSTSGTVTGVNGVTVQNVRAASINSGGGTGSSVAISASATSNCVVQTVGNLSSTSPLIGISSTVVSHSSAAGIGSTLATANATGISGTQVSHCAVNGVNGGGSSSVIGISAGGGHVDFCSVANLTHFGTGTTTGISSEAIADCRVTSLSNTSSGSVTGLSNYRNARNCTVTTLSSTSGTVLGAGTTFSGRTEAVTVISAGNFGISATSGQSIVGCTISGITGTGILVTGTRNLIDGNNIVGAPTATGIQAGGGAGGVHALVVRNVIRNCTNNILNDPTAQIGPISNAAGALANPNPLTNFTD